MKLSAVVMTFNEESNIERCLSSLDFADEIIVLDSFSTDRTVEIAKRFTDKVSQREFTTPSEQRAASVELSANEWVLVVDADEVVTSELAGQIRTAVESGKYDAYRVPRINYFLGKRIRHCGWYPDYVTRLMRKSKTTFPYRVLHEAPEIDGRIGTLTGHFIHYSYTNFNQLVAKTVTYARGAAKQKIIEGRRFQLSKLVFAPGLIFIKKYIIKQGFRDGIRGFLIATMQQIGTFLRYAMLWDMTRNKGEDKHE